MKFIDFIDTQTCVHSRANLYIHTHKHTKNIHGIAKNSSDHEFG